MKKSILFFAMSLSLASGLPARADGHERAIAFTDLPEKAQSFCNTHFKDADVAYVVAERKFRTVEYEVTYTDRTEIDFRSDGTWESVERKYAPVPAAIIPRQISDFVAADSHFRQQPIMKIERKPYEWEIELSGGLEIKFDNQFNVIGYDD